MKRKILPFLFFITILISTQAQSSFNITGMTSNIGCAPYRAVFLNNCTGVDSIFILCEITPSEINNYGDSIVIIYNEGFTWDMDFFIQFEGYTSGGAFIDYVSFPIRVYYGTTPPALGKDTFCTGEPIYITDPSSGNFNDLVVDFGDGTIENPFEQAVHAYSTPGAYTINASWASQCIPSSISIPITVKNCSDNTEPMLLFSFKDTVCPGVQDTFSVDSNIELLSTFFDYGEGLTALNIHAFNKPGTYTVKAVVTDINQNETTFTDTVLVLGPTNINNLAEVTPLLARTGETITFNALGNYTYPEWVIRAPGWRWLNNSDNNTPGYSPKGKEYIIKDIEYFQKAFDKCGFYYITFRHKTCGIKQYENEFLFIYPKEIEKSLAYNSNTPGILENDVPDASVQEKNNEITVVLYPNPVSGRGYIKLPPWITGKIDITVFNTFGKTIAKYHFENVLTNEISIDLKELKAGYYFLELESDYAKDVIKFFKQ